MIRMQGLGSVDLRDQSEQKRGCCGLRPNKDKVGGGVVCSPWAGLLQPQMEKLRSGGETASLPLAVSQEVLRRAEARSPFCRLQAQCFPFPWSSAEPPEGGQGLEWQRSNGGAFEGSSACAKARGWAHLRTAH